MASKLFRGLWFFVRTAWTHDRKYLLWQGLAQLLSAGITLCAVILPKYLVEELLGVQRPRVFVLLLALLIASQTLGRALTTLLLAASFQSRIRIAYAFSRQLNRHMAEADYTDLEQKEFLDLREKAQKFLYGDWHGFSYVLDSAFSIFGRLLTLGSLCVVLWTLQPVLVLILGLLSLLDAAVAAWAKRNRIRMSMEQTGVERHGMYLNNLFEEHRYGKEMRIYGLRDWLLSRLEKQHEIGDAYYRKSNRYWVASDAFVAGTGVFRLGISYGYVLTQVLRGALTVGDFSLCLGAVTAFCDGLREVMHSIIDIKQYGLYYDAMMAFLNVPKTLREGGRAPIPPGPYRIEFDRVCFRYSGQTVDALHDVSLCLFPGEKLSVVGENGAGKSTLIKLLTRIYAPTSGRILLNGIDIQSLDYDAYTAMFSTVFQDFQLYAFSLKENVVFGDAATVDDGLAEALLRQVGLGERLATLPGGLSTAVQKTLDPGGFEPSGGEGQKIALARALYRDGPFVLLDEPTAALDPRAEHRLYKQFDSLTRGKTAVYISHRLASARFCDRIAVFAQGKLVESGAHAQLLQEDGLYAELYAMQKAQFFQGEAQESV